MSPNSETETALSAPILNPSEEVGFYQRILVAAEGESVGIIEKVEIVPANSSGVCSDGAWITLTFHGGAKQELFLKTHRNINPPKWVQECQVFGKEVGVVTRLIPELKKWYASKGAPLGQNALDFIPRYLHADAENECIVMDHLVKGKGYGPAEQLRKLNLEYLEQVLGKLALLHALTFEAPKGHQSAEALLGPYPFLEERFYGEGQARVMGMGHHNFVLVKIELIKTVVGTCDKSRVAAAISYLQQGVGIDKAFGFIRDAVRSDTPHLFYVWNHGDPRSGNMLFKTDPDTGSLKDHVLIDYQMARVGSPCLDVGYFLFCSARPDLLRNNWLQLLRAYFDRLKEAVEGLNGPGSFEYTFEELLDDWKLKCALGFWFTMVFISGFELVFEYLDMVKVETDPDAMETGLREQIAEWVQVNPERAAQLADEIVELVETYKEIQDM